MIKSLGIPIQFTIVFVLAVSLFVYLLGASANARIEKRQSDSTKTSEAYAWEEASLWICPLH